MAGRMKKVFAVLFDGPEDGPAGPAGDGTFIQRFSRKADADAFAKCHTTYGKPAAVDEDVVPARLAARWGV